MKTNRLARFEAFASHPFLKKSFARLTPNDRQLAWTFIEKSDELDRGRFELAVNRLFLDGEKPKNWTIIQELLSSANSGSERLCECCHELERACECLGPSC